MQRRACAGPERRRAGRLLTAGGTAVLLLGAARPCVAQTNADFAQQRYERGVDAFRARRFDDALAELRASLELYASPNTRLYIARCLAQLGRLPDAVLEFQHVVGEAGERASVDPRYAPTRETAAAELAELEARVGRLTVTVPGAPAGTRVRVAEREIPQPALGLPVVVAPGAVVVRVEVPGSAPIERTVRVDAGERASIAVPHAALPPPASLLVRPVREPAPRDPGLASRVLGGVSLGTGGAALASFGVLLGLSESDYAGLNAACPSGCAYTDQGAVDRGEALQTAARVTLGVGLAALVAGTLLVALAPHRARPLRAAPR